MSTVAPREVTDISEQERKAIIEDLTSDAGVELAKEKVGAAVAHKDSGREYVVWRKQKQDSPSAAQAWEFVAKVDATSNEQAVRKAAENLEDDNPVSFVAIPSRSFQPIVVTTKTTKTMILS